MIIKNKEEAFNQIERFSDQMPTEAIEFLYEHPKDPEILEKIIFSLENAFNPKVYYDAQLDRYSEAPLWYSIVAENHIHESLIDPLKGVFEEGSNWHFLNEQVEFLTGEICEEFGEKAALRFFEKIEDYAAVNSDKPYLFFFVCLNFLDKKKHVSRILKLLDIPEFHWLESYAGYLADIEMEAALPRLKELLEHYLTLDGKQDFRVRHTIIELKAAIKIIEGDLTGVWNSSGPYHIKRGHWKEHYHRRYSAIDEFAHKLPMPKKKIGRNDPCPCGSGQKYKKCCLE